MTRAGVKHVLTILFVLSRQDTEVKESAGFPENSLLRAEQSSGTETEESTQSRTASTNRNPFSIL